jgi:hypothetical protein
MKLDCYDCYETHCEGVDWIQLTRDNFIGDICESGYCLIKLISNLRGTFIHNADGWMDDIEYNKFPRPHGLRRVQTFDSSNFEIMVSNPAQGLELCPRFSVLCCSV